MSLRVFAIVAHPDDIEFNMAGTLLLLKQAGCEIHYMNIANGSCGSMQHNAQETARIRLEESKAAAEFLGATFHAPLCNDLEIFYNHDLLTKLSSFMRDVSPDILLTHATNDYMEDHNNAGRLAVSASFTRGMPNYPVDPPRAAVNHDITVYHAQPHGNRDMLGNLHLPNLYVSIDSVIDNKTEALSKHVSQKHWLDQSQGMDAYLEDMKEISKECGSLSKVYTYAEGWTRHSHIGFCDSGSDPLSELSAPNIQESK